MRNIIKNVVTIVLFGSSLVYAQFSVSETGLHRFDGLTKVVGVVDKKKNLIEVGGTIFAYDDNTKIVTPGGEPATDDQLLKEDFVTIRLNTSQRYLNYPLLTHIFIETIHYD